MQQRNQEDDKIFEDEVRRIARERWPSAEFGGAENVGGQERDGIFETDECVHLVEATTSRRMEKAEKDGKKLQKLAKRYQKSRPTKAVKAWFVTRDEPTPDQRSVIQKQGLAIACLSFSQFQSRLIDARAYVAAQIE